MSPPLARSAGGGWEGVKLFVVNSHSKSTPPEPSPALCASEGAEPALRAGEEAPSCNIAAALPRLARENPDQVAIRCPGRNGRYDIALSYAQLDARSDAIAAGLAQRGIVRGTRTVVMLRPTPEFFLVMFALFKAGAVPVLVDPGIDKRALKQCLDEAQAKAFIGIPLAQVARIVFGWAKSAKVRISTGARAWFADATLAQVERDGTSAGSQLADTQPDDIAAILFTSGSTGVPKGVVYRNRHFIAQIGMLRVAFGIEAGGVDLPTFPPFALFDPALGLTSVIPDMDPTRPARANPRKLLRAIERFGVDQLFGSPALLEVLARHGKPLPTLRRVLSAGAPVPADVVATMRALLPDDAQLWTPYGATECLPVAVIEGRELQATRARTETGAGTCVGRPVPPNVVRIIRIDDGAIAEWSDQLLVKPGQIGEITVAGPAATDSYFNRDEATRLAKIVERQQPPSPQPSPPQAGDREQSTASPIVFSDPLVAEREQTAAPSSVPSPPLAREKVPKADEGRASARIVHRMGDLGWFDGEGRLWFCGRKSQRVVTPEGTLCTEQVEPVFNTHPDVRRSALVGVWRDTVPDHLMPGHGDDGPLLLRGRCGGSWPVLCVELCAGIGKDQYERIEQELRHLADGFVHTAKVDAFLFHPRFPVDIRHNAKIGREQLAVWAEKELRKQHA